MGVRGVGSVSDIDAVGVDAGAGAGAGDTTNRGVGSRNAAPFEPKTNASRARSPGFPFLSAHLNASMISLNSRLYSFPEYEAG